jgi:putative SOS response-associated peptidase YedK
MPVVLEKEKEALWLDLSAGSEQLDHLFEKYPSKILAAHTISDLVNRNVPERNSPEVIRPFIRPAQNTLF